MLLLRKEDQLILTHKLSVAFSAPERMRGLLGKSHLDSDAALWIKPCKSIHTFFMKFSIDAVFIDSDFKITSIYRDLKPWKTTSIQWFAQSVVELPTGTVNKFNLKLGEHLHVVS